ncbi:MAG: hypothetical protein K6F44_02755 [Lachnospiraceae bacterium]|nr:hypothetical protein [Lachnospiraceae bacterium]
MENGCSGVNAITGNTENVLSINVAPAEMLNSPPLTLTPYKTEDGFEAFIIHFDEEYEGDLSVKIFSLMAEDFYVFIDGEEYSYAVRGARQTDPGYAMIAGPFDPQTTVECRWGKVSAGVYTREDVENVDVPETQKEDRRKTAVLPFCIRGAHSVQVSRTFGIVLVDVTDECRAVIAPFKNIPLEADTAAVEEERELENPRGVVCESMEIRAGSDMYHLVIRNSENKKDKEQGPDAFMNVTGSFAGELCYKVGNDEADDAKGTYHTLRSENFRVDPYTGYFWGKLDEAGSHWAFQVEEGLYAINIMPGKEAASVVVIAQEKEKNYPIPEIKAPGHEGEMIAEDGPSVMQIRIRSGNGILSVKCLDGDGAGCAVEDIEIRTLSTTAHASDFVPAEFPTEEAPSAGEPEEAPAAGEPGEAPSAGEPGEAPAAGEPEEAPSAGEPEEAPAAGEPGEAPSAGEPEEAPIAERITGETPCTEESVPDNEEDEEEYDGSEEDYDGDYDEPGEDRDGDYDGSREDDTPKADYSDRSVPLSEEVYRSAIENYFGPGKHGIDFWDSDRRERPADGSGRRNIRRKRRPVSEPVPSPAPMPAAETKEHEPAPMPAAETKEHEPAPIPAAKTKEHEPAPMPAAETKEHEPAPIPAAETKEHELAPIPAPVPADEMPSTEDVKKEESGYTQKAAQSNERPGQIKISVYSSSDRRKSSGSQNGRISGLFSSLMKKKK